MTYRIEYAPAAARALRNLERSTQRRIMAKLETL